MKNLNNVVLFSLALAIGACAPVGKNPPNIRGGGEAESAAPANPNAGLLAVLSNIRSGKTEARNLKDAKLCRVDQLQFQVSEKSKQSHDDAVKKVEALKAKKAPAAEIAKAEAATKAALDQMTKEAALAQKISTEVADRKADEKQKEFGGCKDGKVLKKPLSGAPTPPVTTIPVKPTPAKPTPTGGK